jgi:hypothetical protein
VALGAWLLRSEGVGMRVLQGLAECLLGGFALVGASYGLAPQRLWGDAFGLVTAIFFGAHVLTIGAARTRHGPVAPGGEHHVRRIANARNIGIDGRQLSSSRAPPRPP